MTEDEQNLLMGDAASELARVRKELTCLQAKADGYLKMIGQTSAAIRDSLGDSRDIGSLPDSSTWPTIEQIDALCSEINDARTRRHQLTTRLREWGVIE